MRSAPTLRSHDRERFIDDLMGYMTLEEKLGQLNLAHSPNDPDIEVAIRAGTVGGVAGAAASQRLQALATENSRLGIPLLISAPQTQLALSPWALAASWDEELAHRLGAMAADDAIRHGANCLSGPGFAIASDRSIDDDTGVAAGQPHLAARLLEAFALGVAQCAPGSRSQVLAVSPVTGSPTATRRCGVELAYRGKVLALDCAALDPTTALRAEFDGLLTAECRRLVALLAEHFAETSARSPLEAASKALAQSLISEHELDRAVRGVLAVKHALGLFRHRDGVSAGALSQHDRPAPADLVRRSMVLLRNESGILPLSPVSDRILVVGSDDGAGRACADALTRAGIGHAITPGLALRPVGEPSTEPVAGDRFAQSLSRDAAQRADFVIVALEDRHLVQNGTAPWRTPGRAMLNLLDALATSTSRLIALVATDEPVDLALADQHFSAVLQCWKPGSGFEEALADILSGRESPQGRLPVTAGRYEFGQGLGYGESAFSGLSVTTHADGLAATVSVRNSGSFPMRETVQVYVREAPDELRLVRFQHVKLAPGEVSSVSFEMGLDVLGDFDQSGRLELRPGSREIFLGKSSARLLSAVIELTPEHANDMTRPQAPGLRIAVG